MDQPIPRWLWLNAAALALSMIHFQVDWHVGLFGETSSIMSTSQGALVFATSVIFAWWTISLAGAMRKVLTIYWKSETVPPISP